MFDLMKEMILDLQGFWGEFRDQQGDGLMIDSIVRLVTLLCQFVGRKFPSVDLASRSNPRLLGKRTFETPSMCVISRDTTLYLLDVDDGKVRDIDCATDGSAMGLARAEDARRYDSSAGGGLGGHATKWLKGRQPTSRLEEALEGTRPMSRVLSVIIESVLGGELSLFIGFEPNLETFLLCWLGGGRTLV
ncbi:uncharacterized protein LOC130749287 [Lotus japonicus]|uniref:uncharacterized protein LOC130749287 n=1 Tax=Lotus japonicus TaxID=34305 RepID=UPI00258AE5F7|nr:uncharacterized protein LOC130749287 [Lotus japonicus]